MKRYSWTRPVTLFLLVVMLMSLGTPAYAAAPRTQSFTVYEVNDKICDFPVAFGGEGVMRIFDINTADFTYTLHLTIWYENLNTGERIYSLNVNRQQLWFNNDGTYFDVGVGIWSMFHLPGQGNVMADVGKMIVTGPVDSGTQYEILYHNGLESATDPANGNFILAVCDVLGG
ncbi:MAG: hypothetical protein U0350_27065 [Caldilineaceae bacterium]